MLHPQPKNEFKIEKLKVKVFTTREKMGLAAARDIALQMRKLILEKGEVVMIFAAAPSQNEFLDALSQMPDLDWSKVIAFQMDEYLQLPEDAPQLFSMFLRRALFDRVPIKQVYYLNGQTLDVQAECQRYTDLLQAHPVDITCMGIGENGHIAFNDPPIADFHDPAWVKVVELDEISRQQQVNDGCFETFDAVPTHALTLTIPALMRAPWISCVVPAKTKAQAIEQSLKGKISPACPASILRTHDQATLYLDLDAASKL
ncbi:glucosamine-6-phosphate deaminase [candidate division KSB1 bacterium]|nr:glucosamine-6-phosphate deaminase [candidate division KSB1 bacterium]